MGEIDPLGTRQTALDAFLDQKVPEGYLIETRTETHAIIEGRPAHGKQGQEREEEHGEEARAEDTQGEAAGEEVKGLGRAARDSWLARVLRKDA